MSLSSFERFRNLNCRITPTKLENSLSKFRHLSEAIPQKDDDKPTSCKDLEKIQHLQLNPSLANPSDKEYADQKCKNALKILELKRERLATIKRLRNLSLGDITTVGGVAPSGNFGGSGGYESSKPISFSSRT